MAEIDRLVAEQDARWAPKPTADGWPRLLPGAGEVPPHQPVRRPIDEGRRARSLNFTATERFMASKRLRFGALALRTVFIGLLLIMTVHASLPENSTIWNAYATPSDFVRLILGAAVCIWVAGQLLIAPRDDHALLTWFYLGLVGVPFILICLVGTW